MDEKTTSLPTTRVVPGFMFLTANILVLLFVVPFFSLVLFFTVTAFLVYGKSFIEERERTAYSSAAIVILVALLFYYRGLSTGILGGYSPIVWYLNGASPEVLQFLRKSPGLTSIGISYCFLRSIYAWRWKGMSIWEFARYYFFAPTFFSGPVMGPDEFKSNSPSFSRVNLAPGFVRILLGTIKVSLSFVLQSWIPLTSAQSMADQIQSISVLSSWSFAFLAGVWLYLNFSGFSDICIGISKVCNFTVPENFNNPFRASDITDFWRRWHISLAAWLRACIYTPLARVLSGYFGQNHILVFSLPPLLTMALCGLWHGTASGYLIWGLIQGFGLVTHSFYKSFILKYLPKHFQKSLLYSFCAWTVTHAYLSISWVFFFPAPSPSLKTSLLYLNRMFGVLHW